MWGTWLIKSWAQIIQFLHIVLGCLNNKKFGPRNFQIWKNCRRKTLKQVLPELPKSSLSCITAKTTATTTTTTTPLHHQQLPSWKANLFLKKKWPQNWIAQVLVEKPCPAEKYAFLPALAASSQRQKAKKDFEMSKGLVKHEWSNESILQKKRKEKKRKEKKRKGKKRKEKKRKEKKRKEKERKEKERKGNCFDPPPIIQIPPYHLEKIRGGGASPTLIRIQHWDAFEPARTAFCHWNERIKFLLSSRCGKLPYTCVVKKHLNSDFIILIPPAMKPGYPPDHTCDTCLSDLSHATLSLLLAVAGSVTLAVVRARQARAAASEDYVWSLYQLMGVGDWSTVTGFVDSLTWEEVIWPVTSGRLCKTNRPRIWCFHVTIIKLLCASYVLGISKPLWLELLCLDKRFVVLIQEELLQLWPQSRVRILFAEVMHLEPPLAAVWRGFGGVDFSVDVGQTHSGFDWVRSLKLREWGWVWMRMWIMIMDDK